MELLQNFVQTLAFVVKKLPSQNRVAMQARRVLAMHKMLCKLLVYHKRKKLPPKDCSE